MSEYIVRVNIKLREAILDPQGKTILSALKNLGYGQVEDVRIGKVIELKVNGPDAESIRAAVSEMCDKVLANPVMENYEIEVVE